MARPRIGVTTQDRGSLLTRVLLWIGLSLAGGTVVRITPGSPAGIDSLDGLLLSGGEDINPALYGESRSRVPAPAREKVRPWPVALLRKLVSPLVAALRGLVYRKSALPDLDGRDSLEADLLRAALERDLPVLGICRGMQMINVIRGGTLHQEIADVYENAVRPDTALPVKDVRLAQDSELARITGRKILRVNGMHHQAVNALGEGLKIVARENSGIVQALESAENRFAVGVQWHPEYMIQFPVQRKLFKAFVRMAAKTAR